MVKAYLSMGSNIGDRLNFLKEGLNELRNNKEIKITKISSVYETAPVGFLNQNNFLNIIVEIETSLNPFQLLEYNQGIEKKLKRVKEIHWGPRTIDIDIITYGYETIDNPVLKIPHKEALNRAFVLLPLAEITKDDFTINKKKIREILKEIPHDNKIIWLYQETLPF
jgi:2-amino-4-hydroxy-6-hydroxymethyldihydropteridine diphosphokinase